MVAEAATGKVSDNTSRDGTVAEKTPDEGTNLWLRPWRWERSRDDAPADHFMPTRGRGELGLEKDAEGRRGVGQRQDGVLAEDEGEDGREQTNWRRNCRLGAPHMVRDCGAVNGRLYRLQKP